MRRFLVPAAIAVALALGAPGASAVGPSSVTGWLNGGGSQSGATGSISATMTGTAGVEPTTLNCAILSQSTMGGGTILLDAGLLDGNCAGTTVLGTSVALNCDNLSYLRVGTEFTVTGNTCNLRLGTRPALGCTFSADWQWIPNNVNPTTSFSVNGPMDCTSAAM